MLISLNGLLYRLRRVEYMMMYGLRVKGGEEESCLLRGVLMTPQRFMSLHSERVFADFSPSRC